MFLGALNAHKVDFGSPLILDASIKLRRILAPTCLWYAWLEFGAATPSIRFSTCKADIKGLGYRQPYTMVGPLWNAGFGLWQDLICVLNFVYLLLLSCSRTLCSNKLRTSRCA